MKLNLFCFIILSLTITSNFVYPSALSNDNEEVIETDPTVKGNIAEVKKTDFEEQEEQNEEDYDIQVKVPKDKLIVTRDEKDTDELPRGPLSISTQPPEVDPCLPSPCGLNAWHWCQEFNGNVRCICLPTFFKSPPKCIPECTKSCECNAVLACIHNRCRDPCPGHCGSNTHCTVNNNVPCCSCLPGFTGSPYNKCQSMLLANNSTECSPSPCGYHSQCREVNSQAICRCQKGFIGKPPYCRPECTVNIECASDKACLNRKCVDPCIYQCARNANCRVIAHNPICSCQDQFTGDPFTNCVPIQLSIPTQRPEVNPCIPSPCGPNSKCQEFNGTANCTCLPDYISSPPRCRPECTNNSDCNADRACINNWCSDPCPRACGTYAKCRVINHVPYCTCMPDSCQRPLSIPRQLPGTVDPCLPPPCAVNFWHWCQEFNGNVRCICLPNYVGSPPKCIPECTNSSECNEDMACIHNRCKDPCYCGKNTHCNVNNHVPECSCLPGFSGSPFIGCESMLQVPTPCSSLRCGYHSQCRVVETQAICRCQKGFIGKPPYCRPECTVNIECASDKACLNRKCVDPCIYQCARNANCRVIAHNPICSCQDQFTGDPFTNCVPIQLSIPTQRPEVNPCIPSPCGPNSKCQEFNGTANCSCLPDYISSPPRCRPECTINSDCNADRACINNWCSDPCPRACGTYAKCLVRNHIPYCTCLPDSCQALDQTFDFPQYPVFGQNFGWSKEPVLDGTVKSIQGTSLNGWSYDVPIYCVVNCALATFAAQYCPPVSTRINGLCVENDDDSDKN